MNKIPVRIIEAKDARGNSKIGVMLDISYYNKSVDPSAKIMKFQELYIDTVQKAETLYMSTKDKGTKNSKHYWRLSKLLSGINEKAETEFEITNYRKALERDFMLKRSYIGVIFDFGNFFREVEVLDEIPMSVYFELTIKKRKLEKLGLFNLEKSRLIELAKSGQIPDHKSYRKKLSRIVAQTT